ncbi:adenosine deaminase domain-containing protein 1 [Antennarius striatus]|uniref:adenosine deaminase domain-containing protein 1 n=1 Tax=Antennarius striatus TaxID=241820 RepID=UPI0035B2439B
MVGEQIENYKKGEVNGVSLLHVLAKHFNFQFEIKETVTPGNIVRLYFAYCVVIDGVTYKTGMGDSKKKARVRAAELALMELLPKLERKNSLPHDAVGRKDAISSQIPCVVRDQLNKLMNNHPEFSDCAGTVAAFIIQTSGKYKVVALGTGSFNTKEDICSSGRIVHDSHAIVTARRSLMRFLYRHLLMFFSNIDGLKETSIFECNSASGLFSLKSGITFHLYVNRLPKCAPQILSRMRLNPFSPSSLQANLAISLHLSVEGRVFSVFSSTTDASANKIVSMSSTDKLTQWQVLGFQGALLSHFIEPVYVESIFIGDSGGTDVYGLEISVSQRVEGITSQLPLYYCSIRPQISLVPPVAAHSVSSETVTYSVNWTEGDGSLEVVDGLEGKTTERSPFQSGPTLASRLCKAAMLHRFKLVASNAQRQDLVATSCYREAKTKAKPYQEAKGMLKAYLSQQRFGSWLVKPAAVDNFTS